MNKISGVYQIVNLVTKECYVGSSKNIKQRWISHKSLARWNKYPNISLYKDMQKYGLESFVFQVLTKVEPECLKEAEQKYIEMLQPTYNMKRANGWDIGRYKETRKKCHKKYYSSHKEEILTHSKEYVKTEKGKSSKKRSRAKYNNQFCMYNGETLKLHTLYMRFYKAGIEYPTEEAKKYLIK